MADSRIETVSKSVQVVSVIAGVVLSVLSFNAAQVKEADAKILELKKYYDQRRDEERRQQIEASKPFLQLRQERYMEIVHIAGVLANPRDHTAREIAAAKKRFAELYVAELSMVEAQSVEGNMMALARAVDPSLANLTDAQNAAYHLAHALRDSLIKSWQVSDTVVDNPHR